MRLPNGFGSVSKLSGNRRRPYHVKKTVGFNEKGHPIPLTIGYAKTWQEGFEMLVEYNKDPYDVHARKVTFKELFELLLNNKRFTNLSKGSQNILKSAFNKHCVKYHDYEYIKIKANHMQECIDNCGKGYSTQGHIKNVFNYVDKIAMELDIITKSYSPLLITDKTIVKKERVPFSKDEICRLWDNIDIPYVDTVLMLIYSGFRISGFLGLETKNVNLKELTFKGGVKTEAGKNRMVPIHSAIIPIVKKRYNKDNSKFISISYSKYLTKWNFVMDSLNMNHTPHDCRHTFRSMLDTAGANKTAIDLMMGHSSGGTGEKVYTHKTIEELRRNIELVTR